ncbi:MAG: hypothetical protein EOR60_19715 [Mesorhizobium sp.]|nr:MAG: hypothetical protein EOR60_19715 [Mesorhizobium sp.]
MTEIATPLADPVLPPVLAELLPINGILSALNPRQRIFIASYYSNGRNAAQAARDAGYASDGGSLAKNSGYALLHRRPKITAAVQRIDRILAHRFQNAFARSMDGDPHGSAVMSEVYPLLPKDMRP